MKKLLSSFILAAAALTAQATDYVTTLDINAGSGSKKYPNSTVQVLPNGDGTCTVTIKNVKYEYYMQEQPVGNIVIENVPMTNAGVYTILRSVQDIEIAEGDDTDISWQGPGYTALNGGKLQTYFNGEIRGGKFYGNLIIDTFKAIRRSIKISLGDDDYTIGQIPNSGFEKFHTATAGSATSQEPNAWHSFMTATGTLAAMVKSAVHTEESNETRPGTTGKKSVLITTGKAILGQIPNGTITTGQMNAGAAQAANTGNHAFLDFSNEALDANGDPFYATVDAKPDAISVWVKFQQGGGDLAKDYPYATISAVITDGKKYQDPEAEGTESKNVVAKAQNKTIESKDEWQKITIPFDYDSYVANGADPNAILVTISTNATPGKGSADDKLYVDDVELEYSSQLSSIKIDGQEINGFEPGTYYYSKVPASKKMTVDMIEVTAGAGATVTKKVERSSTDPKASTATITVVSADSKNITRYTVDIKEGKVTNGISTVETKMDQNIHATKIYTISGQQVSKMQSGNVYVVKTADGKMVKVVKK